MLNFIINIIIYNITVPKCISCVTLEEDLFAVRILIFSHIVVKTLLNSHCSLMYDGLIKSFSFFFIILESSKVDNDVSYYCLCLFLICYWWRKSVGRLSLALIFTLMIPSNLSPICTWSNLLRVYEMSYGVNLISS
jgi:hypothetical protein